MALTSYVSYHVIAHTLVYEEGSIGQVMTILHFSCFSVSEIMFIGMALKLVSCYWS
jgi:hypothetical protein